MLSPVGGGSRTNQFAPQGKIPVEHILANKGKSEGGMAACG
jgi:hypothetical protein